MQLGALIYFLLGQTVPEFQGRAARLISLPETKQQVTPPENRQCIVSSQKEADRVSYEPTIHEFRCNFLLLIRFREGNGRQKKDFEGFVSFAHLRRSPYSLTAPLS